MTAPGSGEQITAELAEEKHHPGLMSGGRHGCWAACSCGWTSGTYGTSVAAHLAFGRHLVSTERARAAALTATHPDHGRR